MADALALAAYVALYMLVAGLWMNVCQASAKTDASFNFVMGLLWPLSFPLVLGFTLVQVVRDLLKRIAS